MPPPTAHDTWATHREVIRKTQTAGKREEAAGTLDPPLKVHFQLDLVHSASVLDDLYTRVETRGTKTNRWPSVQAENYKKKSSPVLKWDREHQKKANLHSPFQLSPSHFSLFGSSVLSISAM